MRPQGFAVEPVRKPRQRARRKGGDRRADRADHALANRLVSGEQEAARLGEPAPKVGMKPARRAFLELVERHDRVFRARDASGRRCLQVVDVGREQPVRDGRHETPVGLPVAIDQHVQVDDPVRVVACAPARTVEEYGERVRSEALAQAIAQRDHRLGSGRREMGLDGVVERQNSSQRHELRGAAVGEHDRACLPTGRRVRRRRKTACRARWSRDARCGCRTRSRR